MRNFLAGTLLRKSSSRLESLISEIMRGEVRFKSEAKGFWEPEVLVKSRE